MNRRRFLGLLGAGAVGAALAPSELLDPDRAAWKPGAKRIFLPSEQGIARPTDAQVRALSADTGISIRFIREYDIERAGQFVNRFDVFIGMKVLRPELAVRISA